MSDPMKTSGFVKVVYTSGASPAKEDKVVIKDYTFEWDEKGVVKRLVVFYRHFQDAEVLSAFFKEESKKLEKGESSPVPTIRKMLVDRQWAVEAAKTAFFDGFGVYDLITCITGKRGPTLRRKDSNEVTQRRKLHTIDSRLDVSANCSNFVCSQDSGGFAGDLYAVFDTFVLDDRVPTIAVRRPVGKRMVTLDSYGVDGSKVQMNGAEREGTEWDETGLGVYKTFAEELVASAPSVKDVLRQTKSFWIPYSISEDSRIAKTIVLFTTDVERSWQTFDVSTDDEVKNFVGIKNKQQAFDFVGGQMLFRFLSNEIASKWAEVISACEEHVISLKARVIAETTAELAQKIWEGEVFWKYLDQTIDKQIEVLDMFCSELKAGEGRNSLINLEDGDMKWIRDQFLRLKRHIAQNLVEPTHTNLQMLFTIASLREAQTANAYGASMNRLSWVTFIFLPLTFLTGVFGMNVDIFNNHPSIVWYIVGIIPLLILVFSAWLLIRRFLLVDQNQSKNSAISQPWRTIRRDRSYA